MIKYDERRLIGFKFSTFNQGNYCFQDTKNNIMKDFIKKYSNIKREFQNLINN